jgi:hypothetical protein
VVRSIRGVGHVGSVAYDRTTPSEKLIGARGAGGSLR